MSYADVILGGDHAKAKSHIRNLIRIAKADGQIAEQEWKLIIRIARKFELSEADVKDIMDKIDSMSFTPPANKEDRNLQLYNMGRMVMADGVRDADEVSRMRRFAIGLGYDADTIEGLVKTVIDMVEAGSASEDAIAAIQKFVDDK